MSKATDKIDKFAECLKDERFQQQLANIALAEMKQRIFKHGKDVEGNKIGNYKNESYKRLRRRGQKAENGKRGRPKRQVVKIDFQLFGDLRNSLQATSENGAFSIKSIGTFGKKKNSHMVKARGYEERNGKRIFYFGDAERTIVKEQIEEYLKRCIDAINRS